MVIRLIRLGQKCDGTQPICDQCSGKGIKCVYRLPNQRTDSRAGTSQGLHQSSITGSKEEEHNTESEDGTTDDQRARPRFRARSWDRSSRSGSLSEGHQSPEDEGESKKKVDWYDGQRAGDAGLRDTDGVATGGADRGSQVAEEAGTPSCVSFSFSSLMSVSVSLNPSLSTAETYGTRTAESQADYPPTADTPCRFH